jgi:hypothetical protein
MTPYPYFNVALEFTEVQLAGEWQRFQADLTKAGSASGADQSTTDRMDFTGLRSGVQASPPPDFIVLSGTPGVGEFIARGRKLNLPQGFRTVWVTRAPAP